MSRPIPRPSSGPHTGARFGASVAQPQTPERVVFADRLTEEGCRIEVVRYERTGRWWLEWDMPSRQRIRLKGVEEAVSQAIAVEHDGGTIHSGQPGGKQFDAKVAGGRRRAGRR